MKHLSNSIASQTFLPIKIAICLCEQSHSQLRQKVPSPQQIPVSYQRPFKVLVAQETASFSLMSCQKQKGRKKEMEMAFSKEEKTTPILDSREKTIDLDKRLRNISKLLVLGVFLEPGLLIPSWEQGWNKMHWNCNILQYTIPILYWRGLKDCIVDWNVVQ